jgi:hypothetical protein
MSIELASVSSPLAPALRVFLKILWIGHLTVSYPTFSAPFGKHRFYPERCSWMDKAGITFFDIVARVRASNRKQ